MLKAMIATLAACFTATAAIGQEPAHPPRDLFAQAVLGWCFEQVAGAPLIPSTLDPNGPGWSPMQAAETTGGLQILNGRSLIDGRMIIDMAPNNVSCFVQTENENARAWAEKVRADLKARPGSALLDEKTSGTAHSTIYALFSSDDGRVPVGRCT